MYRSLSEIIFWDSDTFLLHLIYKHILGLAQFAGAIERSKPHTKVFDAVIPVQLHEKMEVLFYYHFIKGPSWTGVVATAYHRWVKSSSSHHAVRTDLTDHRLPPVSIVHCSQLVFRATSCIDTELLYIGSSRLSCFCPSMWRGPQECIAYKFVPTSPAESRMSRSSNLHSLRDAL